MRQRPLLRLAGAVAALAALVAVSGCSGGDDVDLSDAREGSLDPRSANQCRALLDALPKSVSDQGGRRLESREGYGAAWGDPALVLTCGVPQPDDFGLVSTCQVTNGVAWFIPEDQAMTGAPGEITMTTVGRSTNVEVRLPEDYWPPAAAMVDLAPAVKKTLPVVRRCG